MAASGASATANRAATAAVVVVMLVVGVVVALTREDTPPAGLGQGGGRSGQQADSSGQRDGHSSNGPGRQGDDPSAHGSAPSQGSGTAVEPPAGFTDSGSTPGGSSGYGGGVPTGPVTNLAASGGASGNSPKDGSAGQDAPGGTTGNQQPSQPGTGGGQENGDRPARPNGPSSGPGGSQPAPNGDRGGAGILGNLLMAPRAEASTASDGAHVVGKRRVSEQILDLTIYSPALGHNTGVRLLLPRDWESKPNKSWPTLYLLPGYHHAYSYSMGDYADWTYVTDIEQFMADKNVLTVLPSNGGSGFFTNWFNGGEYGTPRWETYHTQELPAILESNYRASSNRAIAGLSLGGYGAVEYAVDHPGMYNGVASYSGVLNTTLPGIPTLFKQMWRSAGIDTGRVWGDPYLQGGVWRANDPWYEAGKLCGQGIHMYLSSGTGVPGKHDPSPQQYAKTLLRSLPQNLKKHLNRWGQASLLETGAAVTTHMFAGKLRAACGVGTVTGIVTGSGGGIDLTTDYSLKGTHRWGYWQDAFHDSWPTLAKSLGVPVD